MTTRFPHLPVLGHTPKKRKPDLSKTLTLQQINDITQRLWMDGYLSDYAMGLVQDECKKAAQKP